MSVVNSLLEKGRLFNEKNKYYYFFSKSGFKEEVLKYANVNSNIKLISLDDLEDYIK